MNGLQTGQQPEHPAGAGAAALPIPRNGTAAAMDEAAPMDESPPHVLGVPSMVGVPVHSKDPDARRAFHYQYSVASAWWQRWYQWYAKTYTGGEAPPLPYDGAPDKHGHPAMMMPPVQMGLPAMVAQPPVTGSDEGGSMHTAPMALSDGCTPEDGLQPHSTVSSDAGKSSLLKGGEHKICKNCGTDCTPFWRKDKNDQLPLCNACGLYAAKNGSMRPASLWRQEEGLSPLPRPADDVVMHVRPQDTFPTSAPLPGSVPSDLTAAAPSEALSDPIHPTTSTDGATATAPPDPAQPTVSEAKASSPEPASTPTEPPPAPPAETTAAAAPPVPESGAAQVPVSAEPTQAQAPVSGEPTQAHAPVSAEPTPAPISVPSGPPAQGAKPPLPPTHATAGPAPSEVTGLPPLNKPCTDIPVPDNAKAPAPQAAPQPSAVQAVPTPGLAAPPAVVGHPVSAAPTAAPIPGALLPPNSTTMRVPTPTTQGGPPSGFASEDAWQLPSAAELLSGGMRQGGGQMRPHAPPMMPPGPTLMPSPMVAPYNARFVQLGTIGHGPQQYPIVQFAGGTMPHFRPQRTRSDAHSTLPPLPPLATSAPPPSKQPPGPFVAMPRAGAATKQRPKRSQRTAKARQPPRPALSDSSPMVTSPHATPCCTEMGDVVEEPFGHDNALGDADEAAFDPAELEAIFNDDIPIPLDLREGGCESNVFGGDASSLGDLDCGVVLFQMDAARANSCPDPFGFP